MISILAKDLRQSFQINQKKKKKKKYTNPNNYEFFIDEMRLQYLHIGDE